MTEARTDPERTRSWRWLYFRKRFHERLRQRVKVNTLRAQRIPPGTMVACPVGLIEILRVSKVTPLWVGERRWREEGCDSAEDFFREWEAIHPDASVSDVFYLHEFRLVVPA